MDTPEEPEKKSFKGFVDTLAESKIIPDEHKEPFLSIAICFYYLMMSVWIISVFFNQIILLNFLIADISKAYDEKMAKEE